MERFQHGGDTYGLGDVLDFSASLNPLGMPAQSVRALQQAVQDGSFTAYPDPLCRDLVSAIAQREGVPAEWIVPTAGAGDAFGRIASVLKPHVALLCGPCYSGYEQVLRPMGTRIVRHSLYAREDFDVNNRILDALDPELDVVFLCSPNNPTGRTISHDVLRSVLRETQRFGTFVVLDECFIDFTDQQSAVSMCETFPHLIVVKAFTKIFSMAGLRLGYCISARPDIAQQVRDAGIPWSVSTPAQVAGIAALSAAGFVPLTQEYVAKERDRMQQELRSMGCYVVPSHANFILFQCAKPLVAPMLERGVLIRPCDNFDGLDATWYRVAVRLEEQNNQLLSTMKEVLAL